MKTHSYYEPVLKTYITAFCEKDVLKAKKQIEKILGETTDDLCCEARTYKYVTKKNQPRILIWLKYREHSLLAHELVHATVFALQNSHIPFNTNNNELIAYYIENLMFELERIFVGDEAISAINKQFGE